MSDPPRGDPPRGKAAVTRALLDAAASLFASKGVAAVSVRDVAAQAGVNHGLVHRHFGSKDALRRAVMDDLTDKLASQVPEHQRALSPDLVASPAMGTYWRMLARALLDGEEVRSLQRRFPVVGLALKGARDAQKEGKIRCDLDPEILTALGVALALGWLLFEPFVLAATDLDRFDRNDVRRRVFAAWMSLIA